MASDLGQVGLGFLNEGTILYSTFDRCSVGNDG
jgi:hypothetical protein